MIALFHDWKVNMPGALQAEGHMLHFSIDLWDLAINMSILDCCVKCFLNTNPEKTINLCSLFCGVQYVMRQTLYFDLLEFVHCWEKEN